MDTEHIAALLEAICADRYASKIRKLAEREKALTEALEAMLREFGHESVQRTPMTRDEHAAIHLSKAALALHKEDA